MSESRKHKKLKSCVVRIFGGQKEQTINGRVDVKKGKKSIFCSEIELSGRKDRIKKAIRKVLTCSKALLVVPEKDVNKAKKLRGRKKVEIVSAEKLMKQCQKKRKKTGNKTKQFHLTLLIDIFLFIFLSFSQKAEKLPLLQ